MSLRLRHYCLILIALGMAVRLPLILHWPVIFGGDTILRMANRDRILLSYQLPVLQAALHYLGLISESPLLVRLFMSAVGSLAGAGFFLLATRFIDRRPAFLAALLFTSNPFLLAVSTVPYQEPLMLAALLFAFYFFFAGRWTAASLCLGVACLTRYEAWAACPVLVLAAIDRRRSPAGLLRALLLFGWAPLAWILYRHGLSPGGTYVLDTALSPRRFERYVYLGWITVKYTPLPVLLLSAFGVFQIWHSRAWKRRDALAIAAFLLLFAISILFSAHGEAPDPERFVTAREAHLLILGALLLAAFGLARLTRLTAALCALGACLGVYGGARYLARETSTPHMQLSYALARYLDANLPAGGKAIVLAPPIPRPLVKAYLDKVAEHGGPAALADATRVLHSMDTSPPDYQRTLVHSHLGRQRLLSYGGIGTATDGADPRAEWIAVWSSFAPANPLEARLRERTRARPPVAVLRSGPLSVAVYRVVAVERTDAAAADRVPRDVQPPPKLDGAGAVEHLQ